MEVRRKIVREVVRSRQQGQNQNFFEAVRNLEKAYQDWPKVGYAQISSDEQIRFGQAPILHSQTLTLSSIAEDTQRGKGVRVESYLYGLMGVDGPLPLAYTAMVYQRSVNHYDHSLKHFLDLINHRFISFYYRAYAQNRLTYNYDREQHDLSRDLMHSLSGSPLHADFALPELTPEALLPYCFSGTVTASGVRMMIEEFFGIQVRIETQVFESYFIPSNLYCRLGRQFCTLGDNAQIGSHFFSHTKKFRLYLGPMDFVDCQKMLPGNRKFDCLNNIITLYLDRRDEYDLVFILRRSSLQKIALNGSFVLGRSTLFTFEDARGLCMLTIKASRFKKNTGADYSGDNYGKA